MRKAVQVGNVWKIERTDSGCQYGSFETKDEAEAAIALAEAADAAAKADPSQY
jgi:hypothetical protein